MSTLGPEPDDPLPELQYADPVPRGSSAVIDEYRPPQRRVLLPILLFLATCVTTYRVGGWWYAVPLMITLSAHEFGHFLQAVRYRVPASFPFFIPMPSPPLGTMGAVIVFRGNMGDRKALFDIGISGPLAGLVPALLFSVIGLHLSRVKPIVGTELFYGDPLIFHWLKSLMFGEVRPGEYVDLHPLARAGWVGLFITALNLIPIGQLDGGHVLYALLRRRAHIVAQLLVLGAIVYMVRSQNMSYFLMLMLLVFIGTRHPPTANDRMPLGTGRIILGWLTLMFIFIGFTPEPFFEVRRVPVNPGPEYVAIPKLSPPYAAALGPARDAATKRSVSPVAPRRPPVCLATSCDGPSRPTTIGAPVIAARWLAKAS